MALTTQNGKKPKKILLQCLTGDEIDYLLAAACHHEPVFEVLTNRITPGQRKALFDTGDSDAFLICALQDAAAVGGPGSPEFWPRVRNAAQIRLSNHAADDGECEKVMEWFDDTQEDGAERYSASIALQNFPRYWTYLEIERLGHDLTRHSGLPTPADLADLAESVATISVPPTSFMLSDLRAEMDARLAVYGGRVLLGLASGLTELDSHTDGLRGLTLMGAKPGSGKTTKALEIALGVARQVEENQAVVVIVSADMPRDTLYARMLCNLGGIEYSRLVKGSPPDHKKRKKGWPHHSAADVKKIVAARAALDELDDRIFLIGADHGQPINAASLNTLVTQAKARANLPRAFLVIDYLQLLAVPEGLDELAADRHRVAEIQRVIETSRKRGDDMAAVLTISEMRKPVGERKGKDWGTGVEDLMGTARLGYAADAVLLCRSMQPEEMGAYYPGIRGKKGELVHAADKKKAELAGQGVAPVMFALAKGRDGTHRGKWAEEFRFNTSQFVCLTPGAHIMPSDDDDE